MGISADPPAKQKKFVEKQGFQYPMLCDESHHMLKVYGAWGLKKLMGREYMGIRRITYVVDEQGKIEHVFDVMNTKSHAKDVIRVLKAG